MRGSADRRSSEHAGEKAERVGEVRLPVRPFVGAGKFLVNVRHAVLVERAVQLAISLEQKIVEPAVEAERRHRRAMHAALDTLARTNHGVFTGPQAMAAGIPAQRLRRLVRTGALSTRVTAQPARASACVTDCSQMAEPSMRFRSMSP